MLRLEYNPRRPLHTKILCAIRPLWWANALIFSDHEGGEKSSNLQCYQIDIDIGSSGTIREVQNACANRSFHVEAEPRWRGLCVRGSASPGNKPHRALRPK